MRIQAPPRPQPLALRQASPLARLFAIPAVIIVVGLAVIFAVSALGGILATDGHTESRTQREIVIGNDVFLVPENAIRFEEARRHGVQPRLDLYLHWPDLEGYTRQTMDAFNHVEGRRSIVFVTLEPQSFGQDMSGRLEILYRHLISPDAMNGPAGLVLYAFRPTSGYIEEVLVVGERPGAPPFVARCLSGDMAARSLAPCMRDVSLTREISLSYRFPEELLSEWRMLDAALMGKAAGFLQTDG